jgi:non-canonical (house-cleaning) NTP pyrophosphatase
LVLYAVQGSVERCNLSPVQQQSGAEANVVVGIGAGVVEVQIEHTRIRTVVPVATTNRETLSACSPCSYLTNFIYPPIILPISAKSLLQYSYF